MKVLFHINEFERWEMALTNVKKMLNYLRSADIEIIIEIVANGFAVMKLKEQD
jgi:intracellular sulfur oxidation DsrE/DsrF family protein